MRYEMMKYTDMISLGDTGGSNKFIIVTYNDTVFHYVEGLAHPRDRCIRGTKSSGSLLVNS